MYNKNMLSTFYKALTKIVLVFSLIFCFYTPIYALDDYTVLTELPGTTIAGGKATFQSYLPGAFNLAIGLSAVLAFVMITYGGILYATSDAIGKTAKGREYVTNAVVGLLLVLGAWAILYTINPKMLEFNLTLPVPKLQQSQDWIAQLSGPLAPGYILDAKMLASDSALRAELLENGIGVNASACAGGETKGCTNLVGLPESAIISLESLAAMCTAANSNCKGNIIVSGGTEGGHTTHGPGKSVVDLGKTDALNAYVKANGTVTGQTKWGTTYNVKVGTQVVQFLDETSGAPGSSGEHWHVKFP